MAKKSMIEREKKRIRLEKKYSLKRAILLTEYRNEESFSGKLEIMSLIYISEYTRLRRISYVVFWLKKKNINN